MTEQGKDEQERRNRTEQITRQAAWLGASAFARAGFADPTLVLRWAEIVGADIARIARPIRLSQGTNGGILTIKSEPAASTFLQHESRMLCERINTYLGHRAVAKLRFLQGPLAESQPFRPLRKSGGGAMPPDEPALTYRGPEALKAALLKLARMRRARITD